MKYLYLVAWIIITLGILSLVSGCGEGNSQVIPSVKETSVTLIVTPPIVAAGQPVTLTWVSENATTVESSTFGAVDTSGEIQITPNTSQRYTITVNGPDGSVTADASVIITDPGKIAFTSNRDGNDEIYVLDAPEDPARRVTNNPAVDRAPSLSPNGQRIAFVSERDGNAEIYLINTDGSGVPIRITSNPDADVQPVWSPDGTMLAWTREFANGGMIDLIMCKLLPDGDEHLLVTNGRNPCWSPDGQTLAFTSTRNTVDNIFFADAADGSNITQVTSFTEERTIDTLSWSVMGKIAFGNYDESSSNIYTIDALPGANPSLIVQTNNDCGHPQWSPDGKCLVYYANEEIDYDIYVLELSSNISVRLTGGSGDDGLPSWSRLRRQI